MAAAARRPSLIQRSGVIAQATFVILVEGKQPEELSVDRRDEFSRSVARSCRCSRARASQRVVQQQQQQQLSSAMERFSSPPSLQW